jgi:hypothetical protein
MAELDGLIDMIPIGDIANKLGINEKEAKAALKTVLPTIVAGLTANASDADGAAKLEKTLAKHTSKSTKIDDIDEEDGKKIVNHVFGSKKEAVDEAAAGKADVTKDIIAKILPIVAPIVLAWLASKFLGGDAAEKTSTKEAAPASSGGIGDILGSLASSKEGQEMLGGLLGGLLGGKK